LLAVYFVSSIYSVGIFFLGIILNDGHFIMLLLGLHDFQRYEYNEQNSDFLQPLQCRHLIVIDGLKYELIYGNSV
jgi:hypothetical protein